MQDPRVHPADIATLHGRPPELGCGGGREGDRDRLVGLDLDRVATDDRATLEPRVGVRAMCELEHRVDLALGPEPRLTGDQAALDAERAERGVDGKLVAARDHRGVDAAAAVRAGRRLREHPVEHRDLREDRAERRDRVPADRGIGARRLDAVAVDLEPGEAPVLEHEIEPRLLGEDRGVGAIALGKRLGAHAQPLLVDHERDDQIAAQPLASRDELGSEDGGGDPAFHVDRAAPVEPAVAHLRPEQLGWSRNDVEVSAEHQRAAAARAPDRRDDVRPAGERLPDLDLASKRREPVGADARSRGLAGPSGHELGVRRVCRNERRDQLGCIAHGMPPQD